MKLFPNIVDTEEVRLLNRKGAAAMAIFKVVTIEVLLYCGLALYKGQDPGAFAQAYLVFAGAVLAIFTGGNAVEHLANKKPTGGAEAAQGQAPQ